MTSSRLSSLTQQLLEGLAHQRLAAAVGVVRGGIDEVAARGQRAHQGLVVLRRLVVHAISAEAHAADDEPGAAEGRVAGPGGAPQRAA